MAANVWTVNGLSLGGAQRIESLSLGFNNQEADTCEIRIGKDFDATISGFSRGAAVVVKCNGTTIFSGTVTKPGAIASDSQQAKTVSCAGPWRKLEQTPLLYSYPYVSGAIQSAHSKISGAANTILGGLLDGVASIVAKGTVAVGDVIIPETEFTGQTVAGAIREVLRWIPRAVVCLDYSTSPLPTMHVVTDAGLTNVPIATKGGDCLSLQIAESDARVVEYCRIVFEAERRGTVGFYSCYQDGNGTSGDTLQTPAETVSGLDAVAVQTAGNPAGNNRLEMAIKQNGTVKRQTLGMAGQLWPYSPEYSSSGQAFFTLHDLLNSSTESGETARNLAIAKDRARFFRYFWKETAGAAFYFDFAGESALLQAFAGSLTDAAETWQSDNAGAGTSYRKYMRPLMLIGDAVNEKTNVVTTNAVWNGAATRPIIPELLRQTASASGLRCLTLAINYNYIRRDVFGYPSGSIRNFTENQQFQIWFVDVRTISGSISDETGRFTHGKTTTISSADAVPAGIAAQLYAANNAAQYEGTIDIDAGDDPFLFAGKKRKLTLTPPGVATVAQRITLDSATEIARATFGPPEHLGPQDLIALYRARLGIK